jgi:hypothetical protein
MKKLTYTTDQNSLSYIENASDYVDCRALAAGVAESFAKPVGARFCRLSAGQLFYYTTSGAAAAVAGADVTNGTGSITVPSSAQPMFAVEDVASVSVIAPAAGVVSAEWWA